MFRITYTQGNGYRCGCCRRTNTETVDFETEVEVIEWLSELEACNTVSQWEDDNDREVEEIREIKDENLTNKFTFNPELVNEIITKRQAKKELEAKERENAELERKQRQFNALKKELGK